MPEDRTVTACVKVLKSLARDYPSQCDALMADLPDTAASWAARLESKGVPWQQVLSLADAARDRLRRAGRSNFPPTVEDLLVEWEDEQQRDREAQAARKWSEHDARKKQQGFSRTIPPVFHMMRERGAAVVCHCETHRIPHAARIEDTGQVWECAGPRGKYCDFSWPVEDTLNAPRPSKGFNAEHIARATGAAPPAATVAPDDEERQLAADMSERLGMDVNKLPRGMWLAFGRYVLGKVPVKDWDNAVGRRMWALWQKQELDAAAKRNAAEEAQAAADLERTREAMRATMAARAAAKSEAVNA